MPADLPDPVCKAFLVCKRATADDTGETVLVGVPTGQVFASFPAEVSLGFFARLTDARGNYDVDVLLEDSAGNLVWADGIPAWLAMDDPLMHYDLRLNLLVVFPRPGEYDFVLRLAAHEVARQRFRALQGPAPV